MLPRIILEEEIMLTTGANEEFDNNQSNDCDESCQHEAPSLESYEAFERYCGGPDGLEEAFDAQKEISKYLRAQVGSEESYKGVNFSPTKQQGIPQIDVYVKDEATKKQIIDLLLAHPGCDSDGFQSRSKKFPIEVQIGENPAVSGLDAFKQA